MTFEEYYGEHLLRLKDMEQKLMNMIHQYPCQDTPEEVQPIIYCKSRIKRPDSMIAKLKSRGYPTDADTALAQMHDVVGVRIVCSFIDDVYAISQWLHTQKEFEIITTKDYIAYPKPNGYRSLHKIIQFVQGPEQGLTAEIQLRTIAIDFWAALEHQIKYKKNVEHEKTIQKELKRCANEIASVDLSMQTLRDFIRYDKWSDMGDSQ
ncbi:MAG: GTP pyrophosphokinase [Massiliimalia sp.]